MKDKRYLYIANSDILYEYDTVYHPEAIWTIHTLMCMQYGVKLEMTFKSCETDTDPLRM